MSSASEGTLHCLASSPNSEAAQRLFSQLKAGDPVLLLGKAVMLAGAAHPDIQRWLALGVSLHALTDDLSAYGVTKTHEAVTPVDYAQWVELTEACRNQALWR